MTERQFANGINVRAIDTKYGQLIKLGINAFFDSPLLGIGIGNTRLVVLQNMGFDYYLHNNYLEILASVGVLGAIPYYYMWFYYFI